MILAVTWFVWETWLRDALEEEVSADQSDHPAVSHQQVSYLPVLVTFVTFSDALDDNDDEIGYFTVR